MLFWLGDILGKIYEFYEMDPSSDNEGSGMVKNISVEEQGTIMNLDISPTLEAACELLVPENYLENMPQGGVSYTLLCLLFYALSWLGRAEETVCKGEQNDFSGLRELQPSFLPSPSALPMPMVLGPGSTSGADALGYLSALDALAAPSIGDTGPVGCTRWLPVPDASEKGAQSLMWSFAWERFSPQISVS